MASAAADLEQKKREIFVRNLSYDTTSDELIELFQEIGPIKRGSVTQKDGVSRGFGFIKFALEEDALAAIAQMNGREYKGRRLIIETAVNKGQNPLVDGATTAADGTVTTIRAQKASRVPVTSDTPKLIDLGDAKSRKLQLLVFGVSAAFGKKAFRKYLKSVSRKATVQVITAEHPLSTWISDVHYDFSTTNESPVAYKPLLVTAPNPIDCKKILDTINSPGNNGILHRKLQEYSEQNEDGAEGTHSDSDEEGAAQSAGHNAVYAARPVNLLTEPRLRKRKCRLILRNLSFQATESNIASRLLQFGPLTEVSIARVAVDRSVDSRRRRKKDADGDAPLEPKLKSRGFAFVTFLCENDSKAAVENSGSLKICNREFALDFCTAKDKQATAEGQAGEGSAAAEESAAPAEVDGVESGSDEAPEDGASEDDHDSENAEEGNASGEEGSHSDHEEGAENESPAVSVKPAKPADVKEGKTIFIRDLPFDATASDVRRAFRPYGPILMCVLVTDKETGLSKGSAFLKYEEAAHAEQAVEAANNLPSELSGGAVGLARRGPIYVNGKPTRVDLALDRDQAKRLDESKSAHGRVDGGRDRRNLYLSNEGLGVGSALLEEDMPEADKEKRKRAHQEKRKKLQNPLFFVSATRLCVRNLKKSVNDTEFRDLCIKATKEGLKNAKVSPDDMDMQLASQGLSVRERPAEALVVPNFHAPCAETGKGTYLKNMKAKIMRDTSRLKAGTADSAQSRGYGFVEFQHHGHALACLRQLNNNPEYWEYSMSHANQDPSKRPRLIVEFSLEDTRKVNLLKKRNEKMSKKQVSTPQDEDNKPNKKKKSGNRKSEDALTTRPELAVTESSESENVAKGTGKEPAVATPKNIKIDNKKRNREAIKKKTTRDNKKIKKN